MDGMSVVVRGRDFFVEVSLETWVVVKSCVIKYVDSVSLVVN